MFFSESVNKHSAELHKKYVHWILLRGEIAKKVTDKKFEKKIFFRKYLHFHRAITTNRLYKYEGNS